MNIGTRANLAVLEAMTLGEICSGDPFAVGNALWVMAHGHVTLELGGFCDKYGRDAG